MKHIGRAASAVACVGLVLAATRSEPPIAPVRASSAFAAIATPNISHAPGASVRIASAAEPTSEFFLSPYTQFNPLETIDTTTFALEFRSVVIGDVTGDGRDDVVTNTSSPAPRVYVFPQGADGTLDLEHPLRFDHGSIVYSPPDYLLLGDLNEDGVRDIVGGTFDADGMGKLHLLLSNGHGGLTQSFVPTPVSGWGGAFVLDVDLDGHLDLVGHEGWRDDTGPCGYSCLAERILYGDGKGGFPRSTFEVMPSLWGAVIPVTADLNGDGFRDVVMSGPDPYANDIWRAQVRYHDGMGKYSVPAALADTRWEVDFGDFNHDGRTDIVTGQQQFGLSTLTRTWDGRFTVPAPLPTGDMFHPGMLVTDLDHDGDDDLVSAQFDGSNTLTRLYLYLQRDGALHRSETPAAPVTHNYSASQRQLAAGDINGDGCTDIVQAAGPDGLTFHLGNNCRPVRAVRNDFDGDHASDLLWHRWDKGTSDVWTRGSLAERKVIPFMRPALWRLVATGDLDGDGKSDIVWRHRTTGANLALRAGNAGAPLSLRAVSDLAWDIAGSGDFNGDRKSDLLWRNNVTGANVAWLSGDANTPLNVRALADKNWKVAAIADFDGDGKDDVYWRHGKTGANVVWRAANAAATLATRSVPAEWLAQGAGDFDGDGKADLVWRNAKSGVNVLWNHANAALPRELPRLAEPAWQVAAIGDYDNDGKSDIAWRHAKIGTNVIWLQADGGRQRPVKPVDPTWKAVP